MSSKGLFGRGKVTGVDLCENYFVGKEKRVKFTTGAHTTLEIMDYIYSDP